MAIAKPRVFIVQENVDANMLLNGLLWLKGCESHKFTEGKECLEKIHELKGKVDVVIIGGNIASDRNLTLIINIKKINNNTKILVIADEDSDKTRILGYGADEFGLKPMSPENIADKVLMLMSRETVLENRWEIHHLYFDNFSIYLNSSGSVSAKLYIFNNKQNYQAIWYKICKTVLLLSLFLYLSFSYISVLVENILIRHQTF